MLSVVVDGLPAHAKFLANGCSKTNYFRWSNFLEHDLLQAFNHFRSVACACEVVEASSDGLNAFMLRCDVSAFDVRILVVAQDGVGDVQSLEARHLLELPSLPLPLASLVDEPSNDSKHRWRCDLPEFNRR